MENLNLPAWVTVLVYIGGAVGSLLSLLGIGKLLQMAYQGLKDRKRIQKELDQTNAGKEVDADVNAFNAVMKRLELVEARLDTVQKESADQRVENAKLEAENIRLSKDNERQEKEMERQRTRLHDLTNNIQKKDAEILKLSVEGERRSGEINMLKRDLEELSRRMPQQTDLI